jgi:integrase
LPLNATVIEVLQARTRVRSISTAHVFFNHGGHRWDARNLLRAFYSARRTAGIDKVRFHDLRHTFASRLVQGGATSIRSNAWVGGNRSRWWMPL